MARMISLSSRFSSILAALLLWGNTAMAGINYETWFCGSGGSTSWPCPQSSNTILSSGTITGDLNYNWGGGVVLDSGRSEYVVVRLWGYFTMPGTVGTTYTVTFLNQDDDGSITKVGPVGGSTTTVVDDWSGQHPPANRQGSINLVGGTTYYYERLFSEWGGGAVMRQYWYIPGVHGGWTIMNGTTNFTTTAPVVSVTITPNQTSRKSTAQGTTGSGVYIEQSGDNLTLNVEQHGTGNFIRGKNWAGSGIIDGDDNTVNLQQGTANHPSHNNGMGISITGDTNLVTMRQDSLGFGSGGHRALLDLTGNLNSVIMMQDNTGSGGHYQDVVVVGNSNDLTLQQQNNVAKDLFTTISGSNNTVSVLQKDSGQHYLDVILGGNGHSVGVTQQGSGNHAARIELNNGGGSSTVNLTQQGSTSQNYTLTQTCTNANGCATSVTQQ